MESCGTMENYRQGEVVEKDADYLPFPGLCGAETGVTHMKVKSGSRISNLLSFAIKDFQREECRTMVFSGSGNGVTKTISCVEIMKRRFRNVHQLNKICYRKIEEMWNPILPELDKLKVTRDVPAIFVLLSKDPLDENEPGYQAPGISTPRPSDSSKRPIRFRTRPESGVSFEGKRGGGGRSTSRGGGRKSNPKRGKTIEPALQKDDETMT